jgi:uncharacterized protein YcfJ
MHVIPKWALAVVAAGIAGTASAELTLYERNDFRGQAVVLQGSAPNFRDFGFNDRASSLVVSGQPWEVCRDTGFEGRCVVLGPGRYRSLGELDLNDRLSSARPVQPGPYQGRHGEYRDLPQVVFYEHAGFQGRTFTADHDIDNFQREGFNDRASSIQVLGGRWEACEHAEYGGRCVVLRPGQYPDLASMGLNDRLSSVRRLHGYAYVDDRRYAPAPMPVYDWRRRPEERLYEVPVSGVRAVYGPPEQRCWVEREPAQVQRSEPNVAGAVIGGVIGGILGHQIGGGSGRDIATAGGVVVGAAVGANAGRGGNTVQPAREVQRCAVSQQPSQPAYWDVAYEFRGVQHHVQMTQPPGPRLTVNENGEPRQG